MKPKLILLLVNMALLAAWMGNYAAMSWPDGN
jgi:hypothetical protein